jgi:hypothetical protein
MTTKELLNTLADALEGLTHEDKRDLEVSYERAKELIKEAREHEEPKLGPLAIVCDGGLVQSVNTDDVRLLGLQTLVIDYDTDSAETVYYVPQVGEPAESEAQLCGVVVTLATGIDLAKTWHRYMEDEVTLDCAKVNAESEGYRVRRVPGSTTDRYEWFTTEAVAFVDYPNEDEAWMAAYKDLVQ